MKVTQRWCTNCEGEGRLVDVEKYRSASERGVPESSREEIRERLALGEEPSEGAIISASEPYPCKECGGMGYYFYIEEEDRLGQTIMLAQLPDDAVIVRISGPQEWEALQAATPVRRYEPW
jgi:hypothetical protein